MKPTSRRLAKRIPTSNLLSSLEPRIMFDAAAVATADGIDQNTETQSTHSTTTDNTTVEQDTPAFGANDMTGDLTQAQQDARDAILAFLDNTDNETLFAIFNGGKTSPDANWLERADSLRAALANGEIRLEMTGVPAEVLQGAYAAYSAEGPNQVATIFINEQWWSEQSSQTRSAVMIEEIGHHIDRWLNGDDDTPGDEGEAFANAVLGQTPNFLDAARIAVENDAGTIWLDGEAYQVEQASFNFFKVYEVNKATTPAGKESNSHDFIYTDLGAPTFSDDTNSRYFSGNDVSAIGLNILDTTTGNTETFYGWISRPIKVGGQVKGFYFWTDVDFNTLAAAQADGNTDGDRNVADNRGFILVVDTAYFASTFGVENGSIKNIGSSSDRVDSSMNSLIPINTPPLLSNDSLTVTEDATSNNTGNLLTNDSDPDGHNLRVTQFVIGNTTYTVAAPSAGTANPSTTASIAGVGNLTVHSNGDYTFTPTPNYNGAVPSVTYTATDDNGGTANAVLSITVTPVNDAPTSSNDSLTVNPNSTVYLGLTDFGNYQDIDGDPLAKIIITSLPANGTLEYLDGSSWVTIALNGSTDTEFSAADINAGKLRLNTTTADTTIGFKVSDGSAASAASYTLAITVPSTPAPPTAIADTGTGSAFEAKEAGYNEAGSNAVGNVLSNDSGTGIKVTSVFNSAVAASGTTTIKGQFGTLTIDADGAYTYAPDSTFDSVVDQLNAGASKTETFTYTITDANGNAATSTLTVKINGTNDTPVAVDDANSIKEVSPGTAGNYGSISGNVLDNDTDVDSIQLEVSIGTSDVITMPGDSVVVTATSPVTSSTYTVTQTAGGGYTSRLSNNVNYSLKVYLNGSWQDPTHIDGTTPLTVQRAGSGGSSYLIFSDPAAVLRYPDNTEFEVLGTAQGQDPNVRVKIAVTGTTVSSSNTLTLTGGSLGSIAVGDIATWDGMPTGQTITVTAIGTDTITLSQAVSIANKQVTFADPNSASAPTAGPGEMLMAGLHGYLRLSRDGSYTYTLTSNALNAGQSYTETFTYKTSDSHAESNTATLRIRIDGTSGAYSFTAANDSLNVQEDTQGTVNVLDNDTSSGTKTVTAYSWGNQSTTTPGTTLTLNGIGDLSIASDGTLTFTPYSNYNGPVPTVTYTASEGGSERFSAQVSISISASNDLPTSDNDAVTTAKNTSVTLRADDFGNYNDIDGDALAGVKITSLPSKGSLTLNGVAVSAGDIIAIADINDGKLVFTPSSNESGSSYTTIGFQVSDNITGTPSLSSSTYTLTVHVTDAGPAAPGQPPVNTLPATASLGDYETLTFSGISVADADNNITSTSLIVANGTLSATGAGVSGTGTASNPLVLTGTRDQINVLLGTLKYSPNTGFSGADTLRMQTLDADGNSDTDFMAITVNPDNRPLNVTGTTVNEASPYLLFKVDGQAQQLVTLSLGATGVGSGHATAGIDHATALEYHDGNTWVAYTGGTVRIPGTTGNASLMVRVAVYQDAAYEGTETLELTATNTAGSSAAGTGGIRDDGAGEVFTATDLDLTPDTTPAANTLDDDRPLTINSIRVNEASPYAVFTVSGTTGQTISLALIAGSATAGTDYGASLQYHDGNDWVNYSGPFTLPAGGTLFVRNTIINDNPAVYEGEETYALVATNLSGRSTVGTATIVDDGSGKRYDGNLTGGVPNESSSGIEKDYMLSITAEGPVNEGSTYAIFTVTGSAGETLDLSLANTATSGDRDAMISGFTFEFSYDGSTWSTYSPSNKPVIPTGQDSGEVYVRVDIRSEQDDVYEVAETFELRASIGGSNPGNLSRAAVSTIVDDGSGSKYDGAITGGTPITSLTALDDDSAIVPPVTVTSPTVNEASPYAVFSITGTSGQSVTLSLAAGTATGGAVDFGATDASNLQISTDGGSSWSNYSAAVTIPAGGSFLVRTPVIEDSLQDNNETFTLTATPAGGTAVIGTATIKDDGTGTLYNANGTENTSGAKSNDTPVSLPPPPPPPAPPPPAPVAPPPPPAPEPFVPPTLSPPPIVETTGDSPLVFDIPELPVTTLSENSFLIQQQDNSNSGDAQLFVNVQPGAQSMEANQTAVVQLPSGVFANSDTSAKTSVEAELSDGQPLPTWLSFNKANGQFTGTPPAGTSGTLEIRLLATDNRGNTARADFTLRISDSSENPASGTANPSENPAQTTTNSGNQFTSGTTSLISFGPSTTGQARELLLVAAPAEQIAIIGRPNEFLLPSGMFSHSDASARVSVEARMADGQALPDWLTFDPKTGKFSGTPPVGTSVTLDIRIVARDDSGQIVEAEFRLRITADETEIAEKESGTDGQESNTPPDRTETPVAAKSAQLIPRGKASLNEQLARFGRQGSDSERSLIANKLQRIADQRIIQKNIS